MIPTSNISENNIVFGGEERLEEQIENSLRILDADLYIVVTGCQVEIIGDDAIGVARRFKERKVVGASTPGFLGNTFKGYDAVLNTIITDVIEVTESKEERTINILGVVPGHDVFYRGNLDEIKRLLGLVGVKVNTFFGTGESIEAIRAYGKAALNIVLSTSAGVTPAKTFERVHDIPYLQADLPIGPTGTEEFLKLIGKALNIDELLIHKVIKKEKEIYYSFFERIVDIYSDIDFQRYALIVADSYYAFALTRFIANDLGWIPHFTSINDVALEEQQSYLEKFDAINSETKPIINFEANAGLIIKEIRNSWPLNQNHKYYDSLGPAYVIGTGIERGLAEKLGAGFLSVAFPVSNRVVLNKGYTGFSGGLTLVEDLLSNLVAGR